MAQGTTRKHPFLRKFGRETGQMIGHQLVGGAAGAAVGAGVGAAVGRGKGAIIGAGLGSELGAMAGGIHALRKGARQSEEMRKSMGIGGKKITPLRQWAMPGSIRLAYRHARGNKA